MWKALQNGWVPPNHITEEEYNTVRNNKRSYPEYYVGYVGFHATFGAKYFGGYARSFKEDKVTPRNQSNEAYRNTMKQLPNLKEVSFNCCDFREHQDEQGCAFYCDIPYKNSTKYNNKHFPYEEFYDWCRKMSKDNIVLISEYNMPEDFECIWEKSTK